MTSSNIPTTRLDEFFSQVRERYGRPNTKNFLQFQIYFISFSMALSASILAGYLYDNYRTVTTLPPINNNLSSQEIQNVVRQVVVPRLT